MNCVLIYELITVTDPCVLPQLTQQVARCGPVAGAVDSFEVILCAYMVESLVRISLIDKFVALFVVCKLPLVDIPT